MILILEDDLDRTTRFLAVLARIAPAVETRMWTSAPAMLAELPTLLPGAVLVSLDNDLFPLEPGDPDPGEGVDVARWLAEQSPSCPILVHTSNGPAADAMLSLLEPAGWDLHRIPPLGEDWIETDWRGVVRSLLRRNGGGR